jgi:hypothetical protein
LPGFSSSNQPNGIELGVTSRKQQQGRYAPVGNDSYVNDGYGNGGYSNDSGYDSTDELRAQEGNGFGNVYHNNSSQYTRGNGINPFGRR